MSVNWLVCMSIVWPLFCDHCMPIRVLPPPRPPPLPSLSVAPGYSIPLLVMHGEKDTLALPEGSSYVCCSLVHRHSLLSAAL
jgi:hypothetical protein